MRNISTVAKKAVYASQTEQIFLMLLEITSSDWGGTLYVVNNNQSVTHDSNTYLATAFEFILPAQEDGTISNSSLSISNVDRSIVEAIRTISTTPTVTAKMVLASNPEVIEGGPWVFQMTDITYNRRQVQGQLIYESYMRDNCGTTRYKNIDFPGLFG